MRAVLQRVTEAEVCVAGKTVGRIGPGLVVLLGVEQGDTESDAVYVAQKIANLRIFSDEEDKMNLSVQQTGGSVLMVSQFTLMGDARKGRRPGFTQAEKTCDLLRQMGLCVETGQFQTHMQVHLVNDGPVTLLLDSKKLF